MCNYVQRLHTESHPKGCCSVCGAPNLAASHATSCGGNSIAPSGNGSQTGFRHIAQSHRAAQEQEIHRYTSCGRDLPRGKTFVLWQKIHSAPMRTYGLMERTDTQPNRDTDAHVRALVRKREHKRARKRACKCAREHALTYSDSHIKSVKNERLRRS